MTSNNDDAIATLDALTPLFPVRLRVHGTVHNVLLKLEGKNPSGSIKYRTALSLVSALESEGKLTRGATIVESTSGNLGVALALVARKAGYRFHGVVDPKMPAERLAAMKALGAVVDVVTKSDSDGNFLEARLHRVRELLVRNTGYVWTNQYESPANPAAHASGTGPELWQQVGGELDAVFVAVSTGGTAAGISEFFRATAAQVRVVAVDAVGSAALGFPPGPRRLTGIGSSRRSAFVNPALIAARLLVSDGEAFAMCRRLRTAHGVAVGGSSGATLAACAHYMADHPDVRLPLCLCPDDGNHYRDSIFGKTVEESDTDLSAGELDFLRGVTVE